MSNGNTLKLNMSVKVLVLTVIVILVVMINVALPQAASQKPQIIWADYGSLVLTGPIYNPFYPNTLASDSVTSIMTYAPLALYNPYNNQFYPVLARNWTIQVLPNGSGIFTIYLRPGFYWFNGSAVIPFTAWDVYAYFYIEDKAFAAYAPFLQPQYADESFNVLNNYTLQITFQTWSPIEWIIFITSSIPTPWPVWKPVVEVLHKMNSTQAMIYSTNITRLNTPYWGIFPYYLTYISTSSLEITLEPMYYNGVPLLANWLKLFPLASWGYYNPTFEEFFTGSQYIASLVAHKATWAGGSASVKQVALLNSSGFSAYFAPDLSGWGITFNPHVYPFNNVELRQALCMIFNRSEVAAAWGLNYPNYYPQPIAPETVDVYPSSVRQFLVPCTYDPNKAAQILRSLGFSNVSGYWHLPNGSAFSIEVLAPSGWIDWDTMASEAITQMQAFGIDAKMIAQDAGAYWGTTIPNGQYVAALTWTTAFTPSYYAAWEALSWPWWAFGNAISADVPGSDVWPFQWPNGTCTPVTAPSSMHLPNSTIVWCINSTLGYINLTNWQNAFNAAAPGSGNYNLALDVIFSWYHYFVPIVPLAAKIDPFTYLTPIADMDWVYDCLPYEVPLLLVSANWYTYGAVILQMFGAIAPRGIAPPLAEVIANGSLWTNPSLKVVANFLGLPTPDVKIQECVASYFHIPYTPVTTTTTTTTSTTITSTTTTTTTTTTSTTTTTTATPVTTTSTTTATTTTTAVSTVTSTATVTSTVTSTVASTTTAVSTITVTKTVISTALVVGIVAIIIIIAAVAALIALRRR